MQLIAQRTGLQLWLISGRDDLVVVFDLELLALLPLEDL